MYDLILFFEKAEKFSEVRTQTNAFLSIIRRHSTAGILFSSFQISEPTAHKQSGMRFIKAKHGCEAVVAWSKDATRDDRSAVS